MNCATNIITANFSGGKTHATTARVYQWSRGIELCITGADNLPQTFKAHFSVQKMGGVATTIVGIDERVEVPNVLFTIGKDIHVWLGASETEDDAEILYTVDIPVAPAPMPEYYDAEDTGVFDEVVEQVSGYAATATAAANSAGASASAAAGSASAAAASASSAAGSAGAAEQALADAVTAKGQAETAAQTATEKAQQTAQNASQAALDAGRAESAAERAESAETGAGAAKTAAEAAAQSAAASAATADEKATLAGQSATAAAGSASAAAQSAASIEGDVQTASQKASEAQTAAGQAVTAKEAAQTAQQGAETAATNAGQSASTATAKASEAATSASNAAQSKTDAEAAAARAEQAAATLTVDDALSDTSENPVQNKVITGEITDVKNAIDGIENDFYKLASEIVINATDGGTYETAPSGVIRVPHPYAFKEGRRYKLEVTVNSAAFINETNALLAHTSRVVGDSTASLNTALLRINASQITDGAVFIKEFVALGSDVNILMRYKFAAGTQNISVKVYEYSGTNEDLDALESRIDACEDNISEIKDAIQHTTVCIDATDTGSYETAPSTRSFAHPYPFVAGKTYHAVLRINSGVFISVSDAIRVQQSADSGTGTANLLGFVFRLNKSQITDGAVFETDFVAAEGCVNLLARYKFDAGEQNIDLDVTLTEYITADVEDIKKDVQKKYDECIIKSRMLMGAHRGAEHFAPPNCVAAYEIAGKMGFPWAWLAQIRWSASGTLYVMHNADVSITTNGTGNIQDLTDEYINSLLCNKITGYDYSQFTDNDLRVPTLEKAIQICLRYGMKMCFRIEPFPNQIETELHQTIWDNFERLVKEYGISADWCCYSGYNVAEMIRCITLFGEDAELCPYLGAVSAQDVVDWFNNITSVTVKNKSILLGASNLTLADVKLLHTNGIKVYAFTNSTTPTQEMMEQLATWGVDILQNPTYARIPIE